MAHDPLLFVTDPSPVKVGTSVAAILTTADGRYVLQHRDDIPGIPYPDHWACFGGGIEAGETELQAIKREIREELGLNLPSVAFTHFTSWECDMGFIGAGRLKRSFYLAQVNDQMLSQARLTEGQGFAALSRDQVFGQIRLAPYDGFVLWLHESRTRLCWTGPNS